MNIALNNKNTVSRAKNLAPAPQKVTLDEGGDDDKAKGMVDRIIDRTAISANYAASGIAGGITGVGAWVTKGIPGTLKATGATLKGLWDTEKFGPILKGVAMAGTLIGGVVGGVLALPVSFVMGAWQGAGEVKTNPPRQFNVGEAIKESYTEVGGGLKEFAADIAEDMKEFGDYKLKPGEKPVEIPLIRTGKTLLNGALGLAVGVGGAVVSGVAGAGSEFARGVGESFTSDQLNVGEKVVSVLPNAVGAVSHGAVYGLRTGLATFGHAVANTWGDESTYGEFRDGVRGMWEDSKQGVAVAVAPKTMLLEEVKPDPPSEQPPSQN